MNALVKPIPPWVDVVRAAIAARQKQISQLEQTRPLYDLVAREVQRHCGLINPTLDIHETGVSAALWCREDEPALPMIRGIARDVTDALVRAKLRGKHDGPSLASEELHTSLILLRWELGAPRYASVHIWFYVHPSVTDLVMSKSTRQTSTTLYTARPRDGSSILPSIEPDEIMF